MTTAYMFSGADISGRDELLSRESEPSVVEEKELLSDSLVKRAITLLTVAIVGFTSTARTELTSAGEAPSVILKLRDEISDRVQSASSEGIQPNGIARGNALAVLASLRELDLDPHRVVGDPDGGVALYVFGGRRLPDGTRTKYARVLSTNEGDVIAMCVDESSGSHGVWEADASDLVNAASRIQSFIVG